MNIVLHAACAILKYINALKGILNIVHLLTLYYGYNLIPHNNDYVFYIYSELGALRAPLN